jgi:hypothetical protein
MFSSINSHTTALGSIQPVTEMSTKKLPGAKVGPAQNVENLYAI